MNELTIIEISNLFGVSKTFVEFLSELKGNSEGDFQFRHYLYEPQKIFGGNATEVLQFWNRLESGFTPSFIIEETPELMERAKLAACAYMVGMSSINFNNALAILRAIENVLGKDSIQTLATFEIIGQLHLSSAPYHRGAHSTTIW